MIILDIEASGLDPESYPIEIAWQHRFNPVHFDTFLIRPEPTWHHWDSYAEEQIHHISRASLKLHGINALEAANRLNSALRGQRVYTDAINYDLRWMNKLFNESGIDAEFSMRDIELLLEPSKVQAFKDRLLKKSILHRALPDVRQIIEALNYIQP